MAGGKAVDSVVESLLVADGVVVLFLELLHLHRVCVPFVTFVARQRSQAQSLPDLQGLQSSG